ncbi:VPLPA-CTERM sorting domain-containing protein [Poseidonocella sedimentorum]|nr:VPLPA-CTERM sorting domain-containing protein [Poseidonocella sedimentorum]
MGLKVGLKAAGLALALWVAGASVSAASTVRPVAVTVGGKAYSIGVYSGSFDDNARVLSSQAWWRNPSLAQSLALSVGNQLGSQSIGAASGPLGALFATSETTLGGEINTWAYSAGGTIVSLRLDDLLGANYAIAAALWPDPDPSPLPGTTPVPLPAGALLLLTGLGALALRRRYAFAAKLLLLGSHPLSPHR